MAAKDTPNNNGIAEDEITSENVVSFGKTSKEGITAVNSETTLADEENTPVDSSVSTISDVYWPCNCSLDEFSIRELVITKLDVDGLGELDPERREVKYEYKVEADLICGKEDVSPSVIELTDSDFPLILK